MRALRGLQALEAGEAARTAARAAPRVEATWWDEDCGEASEEESRAKRQELIERIRRATAEG